MRFPFLFWRAWGLQVTEFKSQNIQTQNLASGLKKHQTCWKGGIKLAFVLPNFTNKQSCPCIMYKASKIKSAFLNWNITSPWWVAGTSLNEMLWTGWDPDSLSHLRQHLQAVCASEFGQRYLIFWSPAVLFASELLLRNMHWQHVKIDAK